MATNYALVSSSYSLEVSYCEEKWTRLTRKVCKLDLFFFDPLTEARIPKTALRPEALREEDPS